MSDEMNQEKLKLTSTEGDEMLQDMAREARDRGELPQPERIRRQPMLSSRLNEFNQRLINLLNEYNDIPPFMKTGLLLDTAIQPTIINTVERSYGVSQENSVKEEAGNAGGGEVQGRNEGPRLVDTEAPRERVPGGAA